MRQMEWQKKIIKEEYVSFSNEENKEESFYKKLRKQRHKRFPESITNPLYNDKQGGYR